MSDAKKDPVKKDPIDQDMLENLDILIDMDIYEAEDDWKHLKKTGNKESHNDET